MSSILVPKLDKRFYVKCHLCGGDDEKCPVCDGAGEEIRGGVNVFVEYYNKGIGDAVNRFEQYLTFAGNLVMKTPREVIYEINKLKIRL